MNLEAGETLTPVELDRGDTLKFKLHNGRIRILVLEETSAEVLLTNLEDTKVEQPGGGTLLYFSCKVRVDGHPMTMERYICSQESFYEPYVINGMRIWFDAVRDIFDVTAEKHGDCAPSGQARFAVSDASRPICPEQLVDWCPGLNGFIDISTCYNGDDCWMGPYWGGSAHGGLDINHPRGTPIWAPLDFDNNYYFNSVAAGDNNNRWRGIRHWPDGSVWVLQTHHVVRLLVPEHSPIKRGTQIAEGAGVWSGEHTHSHFVFKVNREDREYMLDPWIIFWQIFENNKDKEGRIRASIFPLSSGKTGESVSFSSAGSRMGSSGSELTCFWTFGDGGWSNLSNPSHTYLKPGIYPVTLVVDDGIDKSSFTQHITIDGQQQDSPGLVLRAPDEFTFRIRPVSAMDVYGRPVKHVPHTLEFLARPSRPVPHSKIVVIGNNGSGTLPPVKINPITYCSGANWLRVSPKGTGNAQMLEIQIDATGLKPGQYSATVPVECPGLVNSPQGFRVSLEVPGFPPVTHVTVDDHDPGFYCTPYFWVGHRFKRWKHKGFCSFYLTNGSRASRGEFVRFTPDLEAGRYEVSFSKATPFAQMSRFTVRVRHKDGDKTIEVEPGKSRVIGTFSFDEGSDGFIELQAEGSKGEVLADAVVFSPVGN
ncbi:PKD domain-containing protein [Gemmatimonadota bacterium]